MEDVKKRLNNRMRVRQRLWRLWAQQYLAELKQYHKWKDPTENLRVGEIVLIVDEFSGKPHYPRGRVIEVHPGADGLVRSVLLQTKNGVLRRSISKLVRLEIDD